METNNLQNLVFKSEFIGNEPIFPITDISCLQTGMCYREWLIGMIAAGAIMKYPQVVVPNVAISVADEILKHLASEVNKYTQKDEKKYE